MHRIPKNINERKPLPGESFFKASLFFEKIHQKNDVLAGSQAIGQEVRARAVPLSVLRVMEGHGVLFSLGGLHQMLTLEHVSLSDREGFGSSAMLAVFEGLLFNFIRG